MDTAQIVLGYVNVLAWPTAAVIILLRYREIIQTLLPSTKVRMTLGGVTIETTLEALQKSIEESLWDEQITREQWSWLERLSNGPQAYDHKHDYDVLMPIRNAGLIRAQPRGFLTTAKSVEITSLGLLLLKSRQEQRAHASSGPTRRVE